LRELKPPEEITVFDLRDIVAKFEAEAAKPCLCGHAPAEHPDCWMLIPGGTLLQPCTECDCPDLRRE
jgi:hypothetical protein